jgi:thiol-disulfide isomerase/thioredoxin
MTVLTPLVTLLLMIVLGSTAHAETATESTAEISPTVPAPPPDQIHCEIVTLKDGRTMTGTYDQDKQVMNLVSEKSGKPLGSIALASTDIVSHKPLVITISKEKPRGSTGQWLDNYEVAVTSAKATHRPILIDFTGSDWCPWCIKLHNEILSTALFKAWASQHVILLMADFPRTFQLPAAVQDQNKHLQSVYAIAGYPTVILINSAGKKMAATGYTAQDPQAWITNLAQLANLQH